MPCQLCVIYSDGLITNAHPHQRHFSGHHWRRHRGSSNARARFTRIAYEQCLSHEFSLRQIPFERQKALHVDYKGIRLDCGYRLDFLVAGLIVVEVKAIEALLPIHQAQLLSYLKLGGWKLGLLINFHAPLLRQGIKRVVLGLDEQSKSIAAALND